MKPNQTFGHYRVLGDLGAGAMGVVYRARDEVLQRDVALKLLPEGFADDAERLARFRNEARLLAELNHPHIAQIHGLETAAGRFALVLELVEGPTLGDKLRRGRPRQPQIVEMAGQLASALEYAHSRGVLHRDLKPANIKLTANGQLKVLDFGLAKHIRPPGGAANATGETLTIDETRPGVIVGTAAYMSPEQAGGEKVDRRADVWAFGCILYEMLTGRVAFAGGSLTETLVRVMTVEPDWSLLPPDTPPALRRLLRRCLQKDVRRRLRDMGDALVELQEMEEESVATVGSEAGRRRFRRRWIAVALAALVLVAWAGWRAGRVGGPQRATESVRFQIEPPPEIRLPVEPQPTVTVAPDGSFLVCVGESGGTRRLYRRHLARTDLTAIPGTEGARSPFFSPDGEWLGFVADGRLRRVSLRDGQILTVCTVPDAIGACWSAQDSIIFSQSLTAGLAIVPAAGGTPHAITRADSSLSLMNHRLPVVTDNGHHVIYVVWSDWAFAKPKIAILSRRSGESRILIDNASDPVLCGDGTLLFVRESTIMSVDLDVARMTVTSDPIRLEEGVLRTLGSLSASRTGVIAYRAETPTVDNLGARADRLVWVDRAGRKQYLDLPSEAYLLPAFSPDGRTLAFTTASDTISYLRFHDLERGATSLVTTGGFNHVAVWTPDGKRVIFSSNRDGEANIYWQPIDGSAPTERLTWSPNHQDPVACTPDGRELVFWDTPRETGQDLMILPLSGGGSPEVLLAARCDESHATFSPNGLYFAYRSNESGLPQVYVRPYRRPGERVQISISGGSEPIWSPRGDEIFFRSIPDTALMVVDVKPGSPPGFSRPRSLISGEYRRHSAGVPNYAVHPDGQRFLMIEKGELAARHRINVVVR